MRIQVWVIGDEGPIEFVDGEVKYEVGETFLKVSDENGCFMFPIRNVTAMSVEQ